ncbi:MAG TPA: hypothetical protein VFY64_05270 [Nitrososphaeraceae archaeon]|nr:hypothetical protein [Nitrososphaeraceae archaeon]
MPTIFPEQVTVPSPNPAYQPRKSHNSYGDRHVRFQRGDKSILEDRTRLHPIFTVLIPLLPFL